MFRAIHARRLASRTLAQSRAAGLERLAVGGTPSSGIDRRSAALAKLAELHLARRELVVIDPSYGDPAKLIECLTGLAPIIVLPGEGGLENYARRLSDQVVDALHLFTAGTEGTLAICGETVNVAAEPAARLALLGTPIGEQAVGRAIHLYGSAFGKGAAERTAVRLAAACKAALAATRNRGERADAAIDWHMRLTRTDAGFSSEGNGDGRDGNARPAAASSEASNEPVRAALRQAVEADDDVPRSNLSPAADPFSVLGAIGGSALAKVVNEDPGGKLAEAPATAVQALVDVPPEPPRLPAASQLPHIDGLRDERPTESMAEPQPIEVVEGPSSVFPAESEPATTARPPNTDVECSGLTLEAVLSLPEEDAAAELLAVSGGAARFLSDGPRLTFAVRRGDEEVHATVDVAALGIEDPSSAPFHVAGTIGAGGWVCVHVEGALAATARFRPANRDAGSQVDPQPPEGIRDAPAGEVALYPKALTGREIEASRVARRAGKAEALAQGAAWRWNRHTGVMEIAPGDARATDAAGAKAEASATAAETPAPKGEVQPDAGSEKHLPQPAVHFRSNAPSLDSTRVSSVSGAVAVHAALIPERSERLEPSGSATSEPTAASAEAIAVDLNEMAHAVASPGKGERWEPPVQSSDVVEPPVVPLIAEMAHSVAPTEASHTEPASFAEAASPPQTDELDPGEPRVPLRRRYGARRDRVDAGIPSPPVRASSEPIAVETAAQVAPTLAPHPASDSGADRATGDVVVAAGRDVTIDIGRETGCSLEGRLTFWPVAVPPWLLLDCRTGILSGRAPAEGTLRSSAAVTVANATGAMAQLTVAIVVSEALTALPEPKATRGKEMKSALEESLSAFPALNALSNGHTARLDPEKAAATVQAEAADEPSKPARSRIRYRG